MSNEKKSADKLILWILCAALVMILGQIGWVRELFVIWVAISVPFVLFPVFGCACTAQVQKLRRSGMPLMPVRVPVTYRRAWPQRSFHRKEFGIN